jgi:hypothetical protein
MVHFTVHLIVVMAEEFMTNLSSNTESVTPLFRAMLRYVRLDTQS